MKSDGITNENNLHMDCKDFIFAKEHYAYYLIGKLTNGTSHFNPRIYLSYKHKVEYYLEKAKLNKAYKKKIRKSSTEVFDIDEKYLDFIQDFINKRILNNILIYEKTRSILNGLSLFIKYLIKVNKIYKTINEIKNNELPKVYTYHSKLNKQGIKCLNLFFAELNISTKQIKAAEQNIKIINTKKPTEKYAISSSLIYQLETYIKDDFKNTKKIVEEYWNWDENLNLNLL